MDQETKLPDEQTVSAPTSGIESPKDGAVNVGFIKKPIFVGCLEPEIVREIEQKLFPVENSKEAFLLSKADYTMLVINPAVYHQLYQQYLFTQLNVEEQARQTRATQNEELKQQALMQALQIEHRVRAHRTSEAYVKKSDWYLQHPESMFEFNEPGLKAILVATETYTKGKKPHRITHADVWNLLDLLLLFGFVAPKQTVWESLPRQQVIYKLILNEGDRLQLLQQQYAIKLKIFAEKQVELDQLAARIKVLEQQTHVESSMLETDTKLNDHQ